MKQWDPDAFAVTDEIGEKAKESPLKEKVRAGEKLARFLSDQDRTEHEIRGKLKKAGFSEEAIDAAVREAVERGYISDRRYAERYVELFSLSKSRLRMRLELAEKGVDRGIVEEMLEKVGEEDEREAMRRLIAKKDRGLKKEEKKKRKEKLCGYLIRLGFPGGTVFEEVDEYLAET